VVEAFMECCFAISKNLYAVWPSGWFQPFGCVSPLIFCLPVSDESVSIHVGRRLLVNALEFLCL
jgi:hypothetical protein